MWILINKKYELPHFSETEAAFESDVYQKVQDCDPAEEKYSDLLAFEDSDLEELVITLS